MSRWLPFAYALALTACADDTAGDGGSGPGPTSTTDAGTDASDPNAPLDAGSRTADGGQLDPLTPLDAIPAACRGFEVQGLRHSPGGDTLPNTCAPFHRTRNNPFAIRCIDADPSFDTGWPGDEWCMLPPPPDRGFQVHLAPADHDDPEPTFVAAPRAEITKNYYLNAPTSEHRYFYRYNLRARPGTHHVFVNALEQDHADGWSDDGDVGAPGWRVVAASQRLDQDLPQATLDIAPENVGIGDQLTAGQQLALAMHHFNPSTDSALREVWVNFWYAAASDVEHPVEGIGIFADPRDLDIPAGAHRELHYRCLARARTRIVTLWGHRHASTDRFGAWIERASGAAVSVYESFDFADMPTYQYDSITTNPEPDLLARRDGAFSGVLQLDAGDELHFVCDVTNRSDAPLRFANEVLTGEMCGLFGMRFGAALCEEGERVD